MDTVPITVIILTFNEEANLPFALESVKCLTDETFVVDSFSTDKTLEIARAYTDKVYQNPWDNWAAQRNWALDNLPISKEWVFFLDADEQVTPEFAEELKKCIDASPGNLAAMNVRFDFYFLNRHLRFAYESPPVLRVIRRGRARWHGEGAREYAVVDGEVRILKSALLHHDRKGLAEWIAKQTLNAQREVGLIRRQALEESHQKLIESSAVTHERPWRRWLRDKVWHRLPRFWRPFTYFFYRYFCRGGFLDGKAGFAYCFLHALWFPLLIDMMIEE